MAKALTAVAGDVFAGFFALGVRQAGFDVPFHIEHCNYGLKTCRLNFPKTEVMVGMENWDTGKILAKMGKVDLMFTNPPCASWSGAGMSRKEGRCNDLNEKWKCDPRTTWSRDLANAGRRLKVKAWIWESVTNAWKYGREYVDQQAQDWLADGYAVTVLLQNNCHLGAPQNRKRMLFVAHQHNLVWPKLMRDTPVVGELLKQKHLRKDGPKFHQKGYDMVWKAATTGGKWTNFNVTYHKLLTDAQRKQVHPIPGFVVKMAHPERLAPLVHHLVAHPFEPRFLSLDELMALSGIPLDWKFSGNYNASALELSRTVLPPVGKWIATAVKQGLGSPRMRPIYRLVDALNGGLREEVLG